MKPKKLLALFTLISSLILSACGEQSTSSKRWDGSCGKCGYSKQHSSNEVEEKQVTLTNNSFIKIEDDFYFKIEGTCSGYQQGELKFAFGLYNVTTDKFEYGTGSPTKDDFKVAATIENLASGAASKSFTISLNLSAIENLSDGAYWIYAGENNPNYKSIDIKDTRFAGFDYRYSYYYRDDNRGLESLVIENLPPFNVNEASVISNPTNHTGLYLKLGGRQPVNYTLDQLNQLGTMCDFQRIEPNYKVESSDFFFEASGNKSYIYMSLAGMQAGETYMTHLSIRIDPGQTSAGKCRPLVDINKEDHIYYFQEENLQFELSFSTVITGVPGPDQFFGALGIIVGECRIPIE